jgi:cobalt-zinc-cadmium efflux system membrane fusion protein
MMRRRPGVFKPIALTLLGLVLLSAAAVGILFGMPLLKNLYAPANGAEPKPPASPAGVSLVNQMPDTVDVDSKVAEKLKIQTAPVGPARPRLLELPGSLAIDPQAQARIRTRFPGEVIEIEKVPDPIEIQKKGYTVTRPLAPGDEVKQGQRLAVIWSKDLGEKKSELVDGLSALSLDRDTLKRFEEGFAKGIIPEQRVLEQRRQVENDLIAVDRARRTLQSWRLSEEEIKEIEDEAARIRERGGKRDPNKVRDWARVDVVSRIDGTIMEKNCVVGDFISDSGFNMFVVADLKHLAVWAHAYEEDLPALKDHKEQRRKEGKLVAWKVRLRNEPNADPVDGFIDLIGNVVDPTQHTVLIQGTVQNPNLGTKENPNYRLTAGQYIKATVELPAAKGEVSIPISALVEDGKDSVVFVLDAKANRFTMRRVAVTRRGLTEAQVRSELREEDTKAGLEALKEGERVVSSGAIELKAALEDAQAAAKDKK